MPIQIDELIAKMEWAAQRGLSAVTLNISGTQVNILREKTPAQTSDAQTDYTQAGTPPAEPNAEANLPTAKDDNLEIIPAPMSGICYLKAETGHAQFVSVGDKVEEGQKICIIEAMKVMTSITATMAGTIESILVEDGASVDADTPLMKIRP